MTITTTTTMTTTTESITTLRTAYRRMQVAGRFTYGAEWNKTVTDILAERGMDETTAKPIDWVEAAESVILPCEKCHSTGTYCWGGMVNGKPLHTGDCYQCGGNGEQTMDDMFRNRSHMLYSVSRAI